jgi:molybdate transport system substrate-binding protein
VTRDLKVFSTIAMQSALEALVPRFEAESGCRLAIAWNTAPALVKRLQGGETADVLILNRAGIDTMTRDGRVLAGSEVTLASSATAIAIKAGAVRPDISTQRRHADAPRRARSPRLIHAGSASGIYFAKLLERLASPLGSTPGRGFPRPPDSSANSC